jgi:hypothetical protein
MQPVLFWRKFEDWLRWYFHKGRPVAWRCSPFKERKGWLVICELLILAVLNAGVAWSPRVGWAAVPLAVYIGVDILIANTVIVFLTGMGISPLRSVILTMFGYFNVALSFATLWAPEDPAARRRSRGDGLDHGRRGTERAWGAGPGYEPGRDLLVPDRRRVPGSGRDRRD